MKKRESKKINRIIDDPGKKAVDEEQYSDDAGFFDDESITPEIREEEGIQPSDDVFEDEEED